MSGDSSHETTRRLEDSQTRLLAKHAPKTRIRRVRWSGGETQILEIGQGPPLFLLHGGMGEAFDWAYILSRLGSRYHVHAVDRPGHGLADPFEYKGVDLHRHARQFIGEILDALELRTDPLPIVANSMGGLWSIAYAQDKPDRVSCLVLVGAPAGTKRAPPRQLRMIRWPLIGRLPRSFLRKATPQGTRNFFKQIIVAHPERLDDEYLEAATWSARRNATSWFSLLECALDAGGMLRRELLIGDAWKKLKTPVVFVWGEKDTFDSPENGERIVEQVPAGGRLVRVADAGHLPWLDEPELVASEIIRASER